MRRARLLLATLAALVVGMVALAGVAWAVNTIHCPGEASTNRDGYCDGTDRNDVMYGTKGKDEMYARRGADTMYGRRARRTLR